MIRTQISPVRIVRNRAWRPITAVFSHHGMDLNGVHGLAHWARVWVNGRHLAAHYDVDPLLAAWFAFLHDCRRVDDGADEGHGLRAALLAQRLWTVGAMHELGPRNFDHLLLALSRHSDGETDAPLEVQVCWDADRLDLGRVGIRPDPRRLCTDEARREEVLGPAYARSIGRPSVALEREIARDRHPLGCAQRQVV